MAQIKHLTDITLTDSGLMYSLAPTVKFTGGFADSSDHIKFGNNSLDMAANHYIYELDSGEASSPDGFFAFWLWVDSDALPDSSGSNLKPLVEFGDGQNFNRRRLGVDNLGRLKSTQKYANANSFWTWENQGSYGRITENQWNHVIFAFSGADQGSGTRRAEVAINGVRTYYTNSTAFSGMFGESGTVFGSLNQGAYGLGDVVFDSPTGMYMDNLYLDSDDASFTLSTEIAALYTNDSGGGNWFSSSLTKHMTFDNDSAEVSTTIDSDGKVSSITVTNGGNYISAPTVAFTTVPASDVRQGDSASQVLSSGVIVRGEVLKYSDSDGIIHIGHVGADDGKYHDFQTGRTITFGGLDRTYYREVVFVGDSDLKLSENEQNRDFSSISDDFLDFTEDNPFGEVENN